MINMYEEMINCVMCFLAVKESLLISQKYDLVNLFYKDANGEEDVEGIDSFLRSLMFLLDNEPEFVYINKEVYDRIYKIVSDGRYIVKTNVEEVYDMTNQIIHKLNSISTTDFEKKRINYLNKQLLLRMGRDDLDFGTYSYDKIESLLREYIFCDRKVFMGLFQEKVSFCLDDRNIDFFISSFSYILCKFPAILEDKNVLQVVTYIKYVLDGANKKQYSQKSIDSSIYGDRKIVLKYIDEKLNEYIKRYNITDKAINKLKIKARESVG